MCGIFGLVNYKRKIEESEIQSCSNLLKHRGPDDSGYEIIEQENANILLLHRRLSILDLSPLGHQPMKSEDGNYLIILNGEIYNFKEIRKELENFGYKFKSNSDTEVALYSFIQWGPECVKKFIGMFAFSILDKINQKLFLFRDRPGVKPLYYYLDNDVFIFGSELKPFYVIQEFAQKKQIDLDALSLFFIYNYIPAPYAIWENVKKLLPGHWLEYDIRKKQSNIIKYWDVYDFYNQPINPNKLDENAILEELEEILISSFKYRLVSDVPVGIFLSGGLDSSLVTALLQKNSSEKLKTYTIGFFENEDNEAPYAKKIAEYLGTDHYEHYCSINDALSIIPELSYYYDEPFADTSMIPTTLVSKIAKQHVTVVLSADGGDEIFGGYTKYTSIINKIFNLKRLNNIFNNNILYSLIENLSLQLNEKFSETLLVKKLRKLVEISKGNLTSARYLDIISQNFSEIEIKSLMNNLGYRKPHTYFNSENELKNISDLNKIMAIDYKTYMVDDILVKVDRATMSVSLEGREPLLDQRIIEYMAKLPNDYKIRDGKAKYLMRKILEKHIPKELWERPKQGFAIPANHWFHNELKYLFDEFLVNNNKNSGYLNKKYVKNILDNYFKKYNDGPNYFRMWSLLMWEMWYQKWG
jgi:asparagine synthase (glutamine-hydrolysing)